MKFEAFDQLMFEFKKGNYLYGENVLGEVGKIASECGKKAILVRSHFPGAEKFIDAIHNSLSEAGVLILEDLNNVVRPNAPVEDMLAVKYMIDKEKPDVIISFGGGSTIDAVKAAIVVHTLGGTIEDYFGVGKVSNALNTPGKKLIPHIAIQTASSSAAHLTKYSNITNLDTNQKKLIVDEAVVPEYPVFDFEVTYSTPSQLTLDGALDGMSHCLEVFFGAVGKDYYEKANEIANMAIDLIVEYLPVVLKEPDNKEARNAICMATDLGGYAIMIGGTSGAHLTSFSLVDVTTHGRACAVMNPYYAVFYAPAIENPLREIGNIYKSHGYSNQEFNELSGRELGIAFAKAMLTFAEKIEFPVKLTDFPDYTEKHKIRALEAAKNPQLKSKLENMPVPLTAELVDEYMGSILSAAETGDLEIIKSL
jgi:alcohol dehydrogenase